MINKTILLGRVGSKEIKNFQNGGMLCKLSIATSRKYTDKDGSKKENTTWHTVNFFNKLAEIANNYARVGELLYIEGEIVNKKVDNNGEVKFYSSVTAHELKLLPFGKKQQQSEPNGNVVDEEIPFDDDIPF